MKRLLLVAIFLLILCAPFDLVYAEETDQDDEDYFELPLCLPGTTSDGTCLSYGPAQTVDEMRAEGIPYPTRGLAAAQPSAELAELPIDVARINLPEDEEAPIYASFEDAVAGMNPIGEFEPASVRYVRYITRKEDESGNTYVELFSGGWVRASPAAYPDFQGLEFFETPSNDFGWIVDQTTSYTEPSAASEESGNQYYLGDVFQVYNSVEAEGVTWYLIASGEWVNSLKAKIVSVNTSKPEGVEADRWIEINLLQQTLSVYEDGELIFATLVSTGLEPFYTQPGVFTIYEKYELDTMEGSFEADKSDYYYLEDVPWTMYFDQSRALHATYWHTMFGYTQSHGCVNLSPGDANWLYHWAEVGEVVWAHDPSGETPTDEDIGPGAP